MKIKICGIRNVQEARDLATFDVDYFGIIFAKSKRQVDLNLALKIAEIFKKHDKKIVGLFTKDEEDKIYETIRKVDFDVIQLHDDFSLDFCLNLHSRLKNTEIWRVFSVKDTLPCDAKMFAKHSFLPLFDTKGEKKGGNSIAFDWSILRQNLGYKFALAGGLSLENLPEAIKLKPYLLDINSGVESGERKDVEKVKAVINLIKGRK